MTTARLPAARDSRSQVFNRIAYQVIDYMEGLDHVADVRFDSEQGLTRHEVVMWEKLNFPYKLPQDLREFYELFNGFTLSWSVDFQGRKVPIGTMRLNTIKEFTRLPLEAPDTQQIDKESRNLSMTGSGGKSVAAFLIDSNPRIGKVAVLYRSAKASKGLGESATYFNHAHQVWLQDLSCQWRPLALTFMDYFRLMVVHLGITGWQNVYTPTGVDCLTEQWMRLYCPERLAVDLAGEKGCFQSCRGEVCEEQAEEEGGARSISTTTQESKTSAGASKTSPTVLVAEKGKDL